MGGCAWPPDISSPPPGPAHLYVPLCVLLVFTPTSVGPRDLGKERYTYTAVGVTATEDGLRNGSKLPEESVHIENVESFFAEPRPVGCLAKGPLTDGENHTASLTDANSGGFY